MRTIAHISDLHFDHVDPEVLPRLRQAVIDARPDVVVVSGDVTQRAMAQQFAQARDFLAGLPRPQIVVPGNHDVPLYNVLARWLRPLDNFKAYITSDLEPFHSDAEIAVLGLNTARSLTFKSGRLNREQVARTCSRFTALPDNVVRIVVTHHPFVRPETVSEDTVGRAEMAIEGFANCRVDLILSGHLHMSHTASSADHYTTAHATLLVQAGTATSSRRRGEVNAFNVLRIERPALHIDRVAWDEGKNDFALVGTTMFLLPNVAPANAVGTGG